MKSLLQNFLKRPKDLTWDELVAILKYYGYNELPAGKTGGSRRKFADDNNIIISLHKPHPQPIVKSYVIDQVLEHLKEKGQLK